jgi:hypothetical protein
MQSLTSLALAVAIPIQHFFQNQLNLLILNRINDPKD